MRAVEGICCPLAAIHSYYSERNVIYWSEGFLNISFTHYNNKKTCNNSNQYTKVRSVTEDMLHPKWNSVLI